MENLNAVVGARLGNLNNAHSKSAHADKHMQGANMFVEKPQKCPILSNSRGRKRELSSPLWLFT